MTFSDGGAEILKPPGSCFNVNLTANLTEADSYYYIRQNFSFFFHGTTDIKNKY